MVREMGCKHEFRPKYHENMMSIYNICIHCGYAEEVVDRDGVIMKPARG